MWGGGSEAPAGGLICTHVADSCVVPQKPTQHYKAVTLRLKHIIIKYENDSISLMPAGRRGRPSWSKQCLLQCWESDAVSVSGTARGPMHPRHQESAGKLMDWPLAGCRVEGKAEQQEWELAKQCRRKSIGGRKQHVKKKRCFCVRMRSKGKE